MLAAFMREALWLTRWQLDQTQKMIQMAQVWCASTEAELNYMER